MTVHARPHQHLDGRGACLARRPSGGTLMHAHSGRRTRRASSDPAAGREDWPPAKRERLPTVRIPSYLESTYGTDYWPINLPLHRGLNDMAWLWGRPEPPHTRERLLYVCLVLQRTLGHVLPPELMGPIVRFATGHPWFLNGNWTHRPGRCRRCGHNHCNEVIPVDANAYGPDRCEPCGEWHGFGEPTCCVCDLAEFLQIRAPRSPTCFRYNGYTPRRRRVLSATPRGGPWETDDARYALHARDMYHPAAPGTLAHAHATEPAWQIVASPPRGVSVPRNAEEGTEETAGRKKGKVSFGRHSRPDLAPMTPDDPHYLRVMENPSKPLEMTQLYSSDPSWSPPEGYFEQFDDEEDGVPECHKEGCRRTCLQCTDASWTKYCAAHSAVRLPRNIRFGPAPSPHGVQPGRHAQRAATARSSIPPEHEASFGKANESPSSRPARLQVSADRMEGADNASSSGSPTTPSASDCDSNGEYPIVRAASREACDPTYC